MRKTLNVGCGEDTHGTHFIDLYPSRKDVIKCDVDKEKLPFKNDFFDEVYVKCLLEHLTNPLFFLKEAYRVLKKRGKLIIITDNAGFYGLFTNTHFGKYEKIAKMRGFERDKHYALFTPHHLKNWLKEVGFKRIKVFYWLEKDKVKKFHIPFIKVLTIISKRFYPHLKAVGIK